MDIKDLENRLNSFDPAVRKSALLEAKAGFENNTIEAARKSSIHNMHCHSFFSYNGYGYSPSYIVYLAKKMGFYAVGLVDFDVLDGVDEFMEALALLDVRGCCGMETRVFVPELADKEINSPGEPGIAYHLGCGFTSGKVPAEQQAFADMLRKNLHNFCDGFFILKFAHFLEEKYPLRFPRLPVPADQELPGALLELRSYFI